MAVAIIVIVSMGSGLATGQAVRISAEDTLPLAPLEPDSAILVAVTVQGVVAPSRPLPVIPQRGDWSLDWGGGGGLAPGLYEGTWSCWVKLEVIELEPEILVVAPFRCQFVSPSQGVVLTEGTIIQTGGFFPCGSVGDPRAEWHMTIRATGAFAGLTDLSGEAVAVRGCA